MKTSQQQEASTTHSKLAPKDKLSDLAVVADLAIKEEAEQEVQNASTMGTTAPPKTISGCPKSTQSTPSCRDLEAN